MEEKNKAYTPEQKGKAMANLMSDFINSFGSEKQDAFIKEMLNDHRTLQQSFTRLVLKWIEAVADENYRFDDRNKASHDVCWKLIHDWNARDHDGIDMKPSQWLPFI